MSKVYYWVRIVASSKGNGCLSAATIAAKQECGNAGLVLSYLFNFFQRSWKSEFSCEVFQFFNLSCQIHFLYLLVTDLKPNWLTDPICNP